MRLFIAVDLDEVARAYAAKAAAWLTKQTASGSHAPRIAWVRPENMHLTIRFLGAVDDPVATRLFERFDGTLPVATFVAGLSGVGAFPENGTPRVIWIGVSEGRATLQVLHDEVERMLHEFGFEAEPHGFSPHLTLGRVKDARGRAIDVVRQAVGAGFPGSTNWRIDHVTLYESRTSASGPQYTARATARLAP